MLGLDHICCPGMESRFNARNCPEIPKTPSGVSLDGVATHGLGNTRKLN